MAWTGWRLEYNAGGDSGIVAASGLESVVELSAGGWPTMEDYAICATFEKRALVWRQIRDSK